MQVRTMKELREIERDMILTALKENSWCRKAAREAVGISAKTLERRMEKYRMEGYKIEESIYSPTGKARAG